MRTFLNPKPRKNLVLFTENSLNKVHDFRPQTCLGVGFLYLLVLICAAQDLQNPCELLRKFLRVSRHHLQVGTPFSACVFPNAVPRLCVQRCYDLAYQLPALRGIARVFVLQRTVSSVSPWRARPSPRTPAAFDIHRRLLMAHLY